jgi:hypothetical protein
MACDRNMTKIVDLIDIFDKNTDRRIKNHLAKRILKESMINKNKEKTNTAHDSYFYGNPLENQDNDVFNSEEITNYLLSDEANLLQLKHQQEKEMLELVKQQEMEEESKKKIKSLTINDSVEVIEAHSEEGDDDNNTITESSLSYISNDTMQKSGYFPTRKYRKVDSLGKQLMNQIEENSLSNKMFEIENDLFKKKSLQYEGYKINLYITQTPDLPPLESNRSILEDFYNKIYISNSRKLSHYSKLDLRNRLDETPILNNSRLSNKRIPSSRTESNRSSLNFTPAVIPESIVSYKNEVKYYEKKFDNKIRPILTNTKDINKIKNHNYLNELSKRTAAKDIVNDGIKKYTEPLFPLNSNSYETLDVESQFDEKNQSKIRLSINNKNSMENNNKISTDQIDSNRSSDSKKVSFKLDLNEASIISGASCNNLNKLSSVSLRSNSKKINQPKHEKLQKSQNQIFDSYMTSLKKSGLINNNCLPIINKKSAKNSNNNNKSWNGMVQTK